MKYMVRHFLVGMMIFALASIAAFGKDKIKRTSVTFTSNVTVNGTVLKAGEYDLKFNEQTGELEILKSGKVVAKTTARLEPRTGKARGTTFTVRDEQLVSVTFAGSEHNVVLGQANTQTGN